MKSILLSLTFLFTISANAQLDRLIEKVGKGNSVKSDGITSPTHKKYMNKIVFASSDKGIEKGAEDESLFISKFTLGEPVIFRVYMDKPLTSLVKGKFPETHAYYQVRFWLNGAMVLERRLQSDEFTREEKSTWTTWRGALKSPARESYLFTNLFENFLQESEAKLTNGDHAIKIEILPANDYPNNFTGPVVATGEITMTVAGAVADPNDHKVCMPKALMTDKALEAKILEAFKNKGWNEVPQEVRITSNKWTIVRQEYTGVILSRYVEAYIGSTRDGKCIKQSFGFYQDHDGSGYQDEVYLKGVGSQKDMSCACLKM